MDVLALNEVTSNTTGFEVFEENVTPHSNWKALRIRGVFQRADAKNQNGRIYPYSILEQALKECSESLSSKNMFGELDHPCLTDSAFSVLTENGWKKFADIRVGDKVWSRRNGTAVLSIVEDVINKPYAGEVYSVKGKSIDSTFTAYHNFIFSQRKDTSCNAVNEFKVRMKDIANNISSYTHFPIPKTAVFNRNASDVVIIPPAVGVNHKRTKNNTDVPLVLPAKSFAAFLGIYLAEGNVAKSNQVIISQINSWSKKYIKEEILDKLSPQLVWTADKKGFHTSDARLKQYLQKLGSKYEKYIPNEIKQLDPECLRELIYWFGIGDGRLVGSYDKAANVTVKEAAAAAVRGRLTTENLKFQLFSVSEKLISDLHECLVYCGESGTRTTVVTKNDYAFAGRTIKAENKVPLYILTVSAAQNIYLTNSTKITKKYYEGNIYCLTTTHGNFYMQQNGKSFWTGNCDQAAGVSLKNVSHVITKLSFSNKDLIGEAIVFDDPGPAGTPAGRLLGALIRNGCTVGISSRGLGAVKQGYDGVSVVEEYKLVTFDCVHNPSTQQAYIHAVNENKDINSLAKAEFERIARVKDLYSTFSTLIKEIKQ